MKKNIIVKDLILRLMIEDDNKLYERIAKYFLETFMLMFVPYSQLIGYT